MSASTTTPAAEVRRIGKRLDGAISALADRIESFDRWPETSRDAALVALYARLVRKPDGIVASLAIVVEDLARRVNRIAVARGDANQRLTIPRLGTIEATFSGKRDVWRNGGAIANRLAARVVDRSAFDPETGALRDEPVPPAVLAQMVAEEIVACSGLANQSAGWRKTALTERGIDPDDYCDRVGESRPGAKLL